MVVGLIQEDKYHNFKTLCLHLVEIRVSLQLKWPNQSNPNWRYLWKPMCMFSIGDSIVTSFWSLNPNFPPSPNSWPLLLMCIPNPISLVPYHPMACMFHLFDQDSSSSHSPCVFFGLVGINLMALHVHLLFVYIPWSKPISMAWIPLDSIHP